MTHISNNSVLVINDIVASLDNINQADFSKNSSIRAINDIDAVKTWLTEFKDSTNTFTSYRQTALRFLLWCAKNNLSLKQITREDIQDYQDFLADPSPTEFWCGPSRPRGHSDWRPFVRGLSASSIRLNLQILTALYAYLVQSGYLATNPFSLIRRKSATIVSHKSVERFLTHKEWDYVLAFINHMPRNTAKNILVYHRTKWIFTLLYLTGCRRNEIAMGRMSDFIYKHNQWWLRVIGKGSKYGEIPVTNDLLGELIIYRKSIGLNDYPSQLEKNIGLVNDLDMIHGVYKSLSTSMLYKIIRTTCLNIAMAVKSEDPASAFVIEQVSTHWLRHTSATHQVDAGIDIRVVKENLRHSMLETTMKYQHSEADARHDETNKKFGIKK